MKDIIKNKISVENNITNENGIIQKANGMFWNMCYLFYAKILSEIFKGTWKRYSNTRILEWRLSSTV